MTTIDFYEISQSNEVPASLMEVRSSAPTGSTPKRVLLVGHRLTTGSVAADIPYACTSPASGHAASGIGSQLGEMVYAYRDEDTDSLVYAIGLADDGGGTAAAGSIGLSGTATASGTLEFMIAGRYVSIGVALGDAASTLLTALKAAIDADARRAIITGSIAAGAFSTTCRWKGPSGNSIDMLQIGAPVAGITVAITAMSGGATAPSVAAAITAVASEHYDSIVIGLSDATTVAAFEAEMARRFQGAVELRGSCFYGIKGSVSTITTFLGSVATPTRNSKHTVPVPSGLSPTPPWIFAVDAAAVDTKQSASDPGVPRNGLVLPHCLPPNVEDRWEFSELQSIVVAGGTIWSVNGDGQVVLERMVTAYKVDPDGIADDKFKDQTTMRIIHAWCALWKQETLRFRRYKLLKDGAVVEPGIKYTTPSFMKAFQDGLYEKYSHTGNVQDVEFFKANSRCVPDGTKRTRLNCYQPIRAGDILVTLGTVVDVQ